MGKISQGILGGFSGKVGSVVGANWKGINYMRSKAVSVSNPRTEGQVRQRTKFSVTLNFLQPITDFLRVGYKMYAIKKTAFNAAMSYFINNAITGESPDFTIDPAKVLVSRGPLTPALNPSAIIQPGEVTVSWEDNSNSGSATSADKALVVVYNVSKMEAVYTTSGATRSEQSQAITIPNDWDNDMLSVHLGFISEDGMKVSNSVAVQ